jgi:predicted N-formylglutamate amidohydrolase
MLVLLYGDGTREGLQKALMEMQKTLQADETELREMTEQLLEKLRHMSDRQFKKLTEG